MSVELKYLSAILKEFKSQREISVEEVSALSEKAKTRSIAIADGINEHAVFEHPQFGRVYAYEVDGYGGRIFMDDANLPSLLSLPFLGFVENTDPIYQNTRKMVLSRLGNPYFLEGSDFKGIGGPHIGTRNAWPMSVIVQILTSDDDAEILEGLRLLKRSSAGLGLMHESGMIVII
jgi:meiotically up-regulated gene 157 (Mug157) protein